MTQPFDAKRYMKATQPFGANVYIKSSDMLEFMSKLENLVESEVSDLR